MLLEPSLVMCSLPCRPPPGLPPPRDINSEPIKVAVNPAIFDTPHPGYLRAQPGFPKTDYESADCPSTEDGSDRDTTSEGSSSYEASWNTAGANKFAAYETDYTVANTVTAHSACRWHKSANTVGSISADGHIFNKSASGQKVVINDRGMPMELSSICMVFDSTLRCRGVHSYQYTILSGELGAADGAGFVFDSKVRRNNIQQMRTVFLNQRGVICIRDRQNVRKLKAQLPPLEVGLCLTLTVDLDALQLHFVVSSDQGVVGIADVCLDGLFDPTVQANFQSGFFCAVVTKEISVSLW